MPRSTTTASEGRAYDEWWAATLAAAYAREAKR
jgi:hypothetical protein